MSCTNVRTSSPKSLPHPLPNTADSKITWAPAIENRTKLAHPALQKIYPFITRNSKLKTELKLTLYKTCIQPIITYENQIWAAAAKKHINKIQITQNKFLRIILNKPYDTPIKHLHDTANIPIITEYIKHSLTQAYNPDHHTLSLATLETTKSRRFH